MTMQLRKLLASDHLQSVLFAQSGAGTTNLQYSPYGYREVSEAAPRTGFTGQRCEVDIGWYFLGNGYRIYNPVLMRFHSPDLGYSPFGQAGVNSYAYVTGDPIGLRDPSGHVGEELTLASSGEWLSGANLERVASYLVNGGGIVIPLALWSEMSRRGVPISGATKTAFVTSIVSGFIGLTTQGLSDLGFDHPDLPYARAGSGLLTFVSIMAGGYQAYKDVITAAASQNSHMETAQNLITHVISTQPSQPPEPQTPPAAPQNRARRRSPAPEVPSGVEIESLPRTPASPQRHSRSDLGNYTRFSYSFKKK